MYLKNEGMNKNYTTRLYKSQVTSIQILFNSEIHEHLGTLVPYPQEYYLKFDKPVYCWFIDGVFHTKKGLQYLNDILARFKITFNNCRFLKREVILDNTKVPYKLKDFQNLRSRTTQIIQKTTKFDCTCDTVFYALKLHSELLIKEQLEFREEDLLTFATENFIEDTQDKSTLKTKVRNIYDWYSNRNFTIPVNKYIKKDKDQVMRTRKEQGKYMSSLVQSRNIEKIVVLLKGENKNDFKKKNGTWHIGRIAKELKLAPKTVVTHLNKPEVIKETL